MSVHETLGHASGMQKDPGQGYWSFIAGCLFLLFVLYIAGKGTLSQWIAVLMPNPVAAPTVGSTTSATPAPTTGASPANTPIGFGMPTFLGGGGLAGNMGAPITSSPSATVAGDLYRNAKKFLGF